MAITAWPFETDDTTEVQFSRLLDALQETGIVNGLAVTAGAGMSIDVAAGAALVKGVYVENSASINRTIGAAPGTVGHTRPDYLIVKRNNTGNTATIEIKAGTATSGGGTLPVLQQDDAIWEHPIAIITVAQGTTNIVSGNITELLAAVSRGWLLYRNNNERPTPTRISFGVNVTSGKLEWWSPGPGWAAFTMAWADVTGKPATFAPVIGAGAGDAVAGNDARLTDARTPLAHTLDSHTGTLAIGKGGTGVAAATVADIRAALGTPKITVQTAATADPMVGNAVGDLLVEY